MKTNQKAHNDIIEAEAARVEETGALTVDKIEDRVTGLFGFAAAIFYEPDERVLGNNGKAYPLSYDFEHREDVESTGEIVTVDKYAFLNRSFARLQCSGLEMLLRQQTDNIERQRKRIQDEVRFGRNAGTDVSHRVDSMADFLGHMVEQAAMVEIALQKAGEAYATAFGEPYVTKAQAVQVAKARIDGLSDETKAKLAKLGVTSNA